ncbi:helix-turn-helix transcriptional regulator [Nocardia sp. NBC_01329]|uniref:helix-turn-helix transcriptional regulator n=1 Tax=Nocardia sp. NBC_01329 TaxID=2903594 RepID=UPI002E0F2F55|nr:AraC family transcriptional regulator [Nocardia sp. NBC_01329]
MRWYEVAPCGPESFSALADGFLPMAHEFGEHEGWQAGLTAQESSTYALLRWDQHGKRLCQRTRRHIRNIPGDEFFWVVVPDRGEFGLRFHDEVTSVPTGHAVIAGLEVPCRLHIPDSAAYAFQVPRTEIEHRVRPGAHMNLVLDMNRGLGRIAADMIRSAHAEQSRLSEREFNAVCDRVTELLCMLAVGDTKPQAADRAQVAESIRRYLRGHIGTSDVRLPAVAHALGWSPRQLRVVLNESGTTFRDLRREEALRVARELLEDPRATMTIAELATRCGFTPAWFSAAFKERFGVTPREFRRSRRAEPAAARI